MGEFRRKIKNKRIRNKGFSLVEVLVAIVILALVAAPILQSFLTSARINDNSRELLAATNLAQVVMEDLTSQTYKNNIRSQYTTESATNVDIIKQIGLQMPINTSLNLTEAGMDHFVQKLHTDYVGDNSSSKVRYTFWTNNVECLSVDIHSIKQDNFEFDVVFVLTPSVGAVTDNGFYTYDVELRVYGVNEGRHYEKRLVTIHGAVSNQR